MIDMTLTIQLPAEVEKKLRDRAAERGLAPDDYALKLIEQALHGESPSSVPADTTTESKTFDEILAPFRKEVEDSGMTDEELRDLFTETLNEVRAERRA